MDRTHDTNDARSVEHARLQREQQAQSRLLLRGADDLARRPWRPEPAPPTAVDLTQFALWKAADLTPHEILDAVALLPAARDEADGAEIGLIFHARSAGLTWAQIADAMGFRSPQACQQYVSRLSARRSGHE